MSMQDILLIAGFALVGTGVLLLGVAAFIFFTRNIRDIVADLNGTKRAEALAAMAQEASHARRRTKAGERTGALSSEALAFGTVDVVQNGVPNENQPAPVQPDDSLLFDSDAGDAAAASSDDGSSVTTVMADDSNPTTVLDADAADVTTLLVEDDKQTLDSAEAAEDESVVVKVPVGTFMSGEVTEESIRDSFHVVRKLILTQSMEYVQAVRGEDHA